jgi:hypothetical protein
VRLAQAYLPCVDNWFSAVKKQKASSTFHLFKNFFYLAKTSTDQLRLLPCFLIKDFLAFRAISNTFTIVRILQRKRKLPDQQRQVNANIIMSNPTSDRQHPVSETGEGLTQVSILLPYLARSQVTDILKGHLPANFLESSPAVAMSGELPVTAAAITATTVATTIAIATIGTASAGVAATIAAGLESPRHKDVLMDWNEDIEDELWSGMSGIPHQRKLRRQPKPLSPPKPPASTNPTQDILPPGATRSQEQIEKAEKMKRAVAENVKKREAADREREARRSEERARADAQSGTNMNAPFTSAVIPGTGTYPPPPSRPLPPPGAEPPMDQPTVPFPDYPHSFRHQGDSIFNHFMENLIATGGERINRAYSQVQLSLAPGQNPPFGMEYLYYGRGLTYAEAPILPVVEGRSYLTAIKSAKTGRIVGVHDTFRLENGGICLLFNEDNPETWTGGTFM